MSIALVGSTPSNKSRIDLGLFSKRAELVNGYASYARAGDDRHMLWHAGRHWFVGRSENVGKAMGFVKALDGARLPDLVNATWHIYEGTQWFAAPAVQCVAGPALSRRLSAGASKVVLHGSTPQGLKQNWLGWFSRRAELVNGYPSYAKDGDALIMWHAGQSWFVGKSDHVGADKGLIAASDGALQPELVVATWQVAGVGGGWLDAPDLSCTCPARLPPQAPLRRN